MGCRGHIQHRGQSVSRHHALVPTGRRTRRRRRQLLVRHIRRCRHFDVSFAPAPSQLTSGFLESSSDFVLTLYPIPTVSSSVAFTMLLGSIYYPNFNTTRFVRRYYRWAAARPHIGSSRSLVSELLYGIAHMMRPVDSSQTRARRRLNRRI